MGFLDILQHYAQGAAAPERADQHFDQVAREAPPELVGQGIAEALRSDSTPPLSEMVGQLFGQSNPQQRAGLLNELTRSLGPTVLSSIAGGALGRVLGGAGAAVPAGAPSVTPAQASQITPEQASEVAAQAEAHDPSIAERIGGFYAQHPQVVKALGGVALAIALGHMARRNDA